MDYISGLLSERSGQVVVAGEGRKAVACGKASASGSVSQRACVFCGSRVVLYPVADALHLVHGPVGCASFTWDIRGALSSGPELHRKSFSTNLGEHDVIFGGEKKLASMLSALIDEYKPKTAFVYATCIIGLIGDDVDAVCRKASREKNIPVIPVHSEGFKGTKKDGYKAASDALLSLMRPPAERQPLPGQPGGGISAAETPAINILGEFNLAGETWIIKSYFEAMDVRINAVLTGDGRVADIQNVPKAALNIVQCSGSMVYLAKKMEELWGIPWIQVSFFGIEETSEALYSVAGFFENHPSVLIKARNIVSLEIETLLPVLAKYRHNLEGKRAAVYVGGGFKAKSLVRAFRYLGMKTVLVGSQTGSAADYEDLAGLCDPGTVIVDDSNPIELARFIIETQADVFVGGVKERPIANKLGIGFCDHNHERKIPLAGFEGMKNFAKEIHATILSPVWRFAPLRRNAAADLAGERK